MTRVMYTAILAGLLLLIPVAAGQFSSATDPRRVNSSTDPRRANSTSRKAEPADDPILIVNPWNRYGSNDLLGKVLLPERIDTPRNDGNAGQAGFVGPQACAECHRGRFERFTQTSHFRSSQVANADTIMGTFQPPGNEVATREPRLHYRMDARADGFYQTVVVDGRDVHAERMDIVFGSGKLGQSYLYWRDDELFQLPISYLTAPDSWMNSPGYPDGMADFRRPVVGGCLQCHSTWFDARSDDLMTHRFAPEGFVLGVTCERCHGPGDEHVAHHQAHPDDQQAQHIVHPGRLPQERLTDVCRQCHGGLAQPRRPAFSFRPGEVLTDNVEPPAGRPGMHTNDQFQRLSESRCFLESPGMTCITCHNPHQYERGNDALFALRCQQCHEVADHPLQPQIGSALGDNCTRCHMPRSPLLETPLKSKDGVVFPEMVDHLIRTGVSDRQLEEQLRAAAGDR